MTDFRRHFIYGLMFTFGIVFALIAIFTTIAALRPAHSQTAPGGNFFIDKQGNVRPGPPYSINSYDPVLVSGLTPGSVVFAGAGGKTAQDNANFRWDNTNKSLTVGLVNPNVAFQNIGVVKSGYAEISVSGDSGVSYVSLFSGSGQGIYSTLPLAPITIQSDNSIAVFGYPGANPGLVLGDTDAIHPMLLRAGAAFKVRLGDDSDDAAISALTVQTKGFTVATLPAAGSAGRRAFVTDQAAACVAAGAALTGGGAIVCPVFDNGVAWVGD